MIVELTADSPEVAEGNEGRRASAHADLRRWLGGDYRSNNMFRAKANHDVHQHA
jgi:glyoxylase I family protein